MDRNVQELRQGLTEICKNYGRYRGTSSVVVDIPFIPYIPDNWNGVLVLAEAQNLQVLLRSSENLSTLSRYGLFQKLRCQ